MHFAIVLRLDVVERSSFVAECRSRVGSQCRRGSQWLAAGDQPQKLESQNLEKKSLGSLQDTRKPLEAGGRGQDLCQERDKNLRVKSERPM